LQISLDNVPVVSSVQQYSEVMETNDERRPARVSRANMGLSWHPRPCTANQHSVRPFFATASRFPWSSSSFRPIFLGANNKACQDLGSENEASWKFTVRDQYFSRFSLVENCSVSECSNGVRPMRISKKVIPSAHTSDLRVSCGKPRARSGDKYCASTR
jgi:hypothetical protein